MAGASAGSPASQAFCGSKILAQAEFTSAEQVKSKEGSRKSSGFLGEGDEMAKEWARKFYRSVSWRTLRAEVLHRDLYSCEECGGRATEVHHAIPLTPENIDDPTVALNPALLHSLCHDCHAAITLGRTDCADGFFFDADGQLTPREG